MVVQWLLNHCKIPGIDAVQKNCGKVRYKLTYRQAIAELKYINSEAIVNK